MVDRRTDARTLASDAGYGRVIGDSRHALQSSPMALSEIERITDPQQVASLVEEARGEGRCAVDTEFVWERTYAPALCLIQIATSGTLAVVDPLAGGAAGADRRVDGRCGGDKGDARRVRRPGGVRAAFRRAPSARSTTRSSRAASPGSGARCRWSGCWTRRSERQAAARRGLHRLAEAAADRDAGRVRGRRCTLPARLPPTRSTRGWTSWAERRGWRRSSTTGSARQAALVQDPDTAWRRVAGRGKLRGAQLGVLVSVAAWREREARERNMPAAWLVKDATLVELARRRPKTAAQAEGVRRLESAPRSAPGRLAGGDRGCGRPAARRARPSSPATCGGGCARCCRWPSSVLQARCAEAGIASELVATRADVEALIVHEALGDADSQPLLQGMAPRAGR